MENNSIEAVRNAICRRVIHSHVDLITTYGIEAVMDAINEQAEFSGAGGLEEIGSSDVSCWIMSIKECLARQVKS